MLKNKYIFSSMVVLGTSLFGSNIPKITDSDLNRIINNNNSQVVFNENDKKEIRKIYNIKEENTNFKVKNTISTIKDNSFKLDNEFSREKSKFSLKNLLVELENIQRNRDRNLNREYPTVFITKDDMSIYLSNNEYNTIKKSFSINEAIQLINQYTGLSLSYKAENTNSQYAKVLNIGVWNNYDIDNTKKYLTLEPKNTPTYLYGSTTDDKAFFYFKNYNKQYNKDVYFDLGAKQILDLYEKLISWGVDKEYYNNILASQFFKSTANNKNFNSQKAYNDLVKNPTIFLVKELRSSLDSTNTSTNNARVSVVNNQTLHSIIEQFNSSGNKISYIDAENIELQNLGIQLSVSNPNITITSITDLEKYDFFDKKTNQITKFKIVSNGYSYSSEKDFIVHTKKDTKQQAIHYLDMAIKNAKELKNHDFSYEIFKDDINNIKKGLL